MIVPGGQGKCRIIVALAYLLLETTTATIYLVFANEGLMKRDQTEFEGFWTFIRSLNKGNFNRVKYIHDFSKVTKSKEAIIVLDEGDETILKDLKKFWNKSKQDCFDVISLTATAHDGN